jgi:tetratricopeptide (TPR) repeat protein
LIFISIALILVYESDDGQFSFWTNTKSMHYTTTNSKTWWARAYGNLGNAHQPLGDFAQAIAYYTQDLAIAREVGDRAGEGKVYGGLGNTHQWLGDFSQAIAYHTQWLAIAREVGDRAGEGKAYGNLGNVHNSMGDFSQAIAYHTQDLAIAREVGNRTGEGRSNGNLGNAHLQRPHIQRVLDCQCPPLCNIRERTSCKPLSYVPAPQQLCDTSSCGKRARKWHFQGTSTHARMQSPHAPLATHATLCKVVVRKPADF